MRNVLTLLILASVTLLTACQSRSKEVSTTKNETAKEKAAKSEPSIPMADFTMASIDGPELSALDEVRKHQLTIIDFWASWCGPCMREMPNLVSIYSEYKDKGLGIIGVSLDHDADAWKSTVKEMRMEWLQLSDLQGWNNSAAQLYGVNSIPCTLIVDANGNIIAANLRGEQLRQFVQEHLQ